MQADAPAAARLAIAGLDVRFGARQVVSVDELSLGEAEIVGLAGESGSGKSMTTLAVLGLAYTVGATVSGSITLDGTELVGLSQRALRDLRGRRSARQDPRSPASPRQVHPPACNRTLPRHSSRTADEARPGGGPGGAAPPPVPLAGTP